MRNRLARLRPTVDERVDGVFGLVLVGLALWSFESSFGDIGFWVVGMAMAVLGAVTLQVLDRSGVPLVGRVAIWLGVFFVSGWVVASPAGRVAGVLPSPQGLRDMVTVPIEGWKQLLSTVPPVGGSNQLVVLVALLGLAGAATTLAAARLRPWPIVPAAPAVVVLALGILCGTLEPVSVVLNGAIFTFVVVVWAAVRDARRRRTTRSAGKVRRAASLGSFVLVASLFGLVVGPSLLFVDARDRVVWRDTFDPPFDPSEFASPLGYYRQFVKEWKDAPLFEVRGLPAGVPIRLATLDEYDGIVWKVSGGARALPGTAGYFQRVGTDVSPEFPGEMASVTITFPVDSVFDEVWIPTVGEVETISFDGSRSRTLSDAFRYNISTDTAAMLTELSAGDSYTVTATVPINLDDVPADAVFGESLDPIDGVDGSVTGLGSGLVEDVEGIERVRILVGYFRREGFYSDAVEEDGQALVPPGHGVGRLKAFADSSALVGNAEQYAATLALILRNSGIPARVVVGWLPETDAAGVATVTGTDTEAWVEVLVDGVGWVAAFPTPDRSKTSIEVDNSPRPIPDRETQVPPPPPVVQADADTEPAGESRQQEREREEADDDTDDELDGGGGVSWLVIAAGLAVLVPLLVIVVFVGSVLLIKRRRRRRRRRSGRTDEQIANGWRELVDLAVDTGRQVPEVATRREMVAAIGVDGANDLAQRADAAVFDVGEPSAEQVESYWSDVDEARRRSTAELSMIERWKAHVNLESIRLNRADRRRDRRR